MVRFVGRFVRPSKETTSSLVPPSFLVVVAPLILRRTKKFGGKFHPRDCALSLSRKGRSRSGSNRSSLREEREERKARPWERSGTIVEIIIRSWKKISRVLFQFVSRRALPRKIEGRDAATGVVFLVATFGTVCGNRAFQRSEADTELDESGEERRGKRVE